MAMIEHSYGDKPVTTTTVHGECPSRFLAVREAFTNLFTQGLEVGASIAIYLDGQPTVDLWGGYTDSAQTQPWSRNTLTHVWSTVKTMTSLCALLLADRGELDLDNTVSTYWPEFSQAGKEEILVRHLMAHTAGLPDWDDPITVNDLYDWENTCIRLARQTPRWKPGSAAGYHITTQGFLIGEVIRRITGQLVGEFFAHEIAAPLDADFYIGLPAEHDHRISNSIPPVDQPIRPATTPRISVRRIVHPEDTWTTSWRRAQIPSVGGFGNARSIAYIQSILAGSGTLHNKTFLSENTCNQVFRQQASGIDLVLGQGMTYGIGYGLNSPHLLISPNPRTCFWGGRGGSFIAVDLDAKLTVAYAMNKMTSIGLRDPRAHTIIQATYKALGA